MVKESLTGFDHPPSTASPSASPSEMKLRETKAHRIVSFKRGPLGQASQQRPCETDRAERGVARLSTYLSSHFQTVSDLFIHIPEKPGLPQQLS